MAVRAQEVISVTGVGSYSPGEPIGNDRLEAALGVPVTTMMRYFGIEQRYFAVSPETGLTLEPNLGAMEMAARAAEVALDRAGVHPKSVDLLITATSTPDHELPPFPFELQRRLGIPRCQILDVRGGCASSLQGVKVAQAMLQAGMSDCALVCGSECISPKYYSPLLKIDAPRTEQVMNAAAFADGAGAVVLNRHAENTVGIQGLDLSFLQLTSRFTDQRTGFRLKAGVATHDNRAMKSTLPRVIGTARDEFLERIGGVEHVDLLIVPQANGALMSLTEGHLLNDKKFYVGNETGNTPAAAIFRAMDIAMARQQLRPGVTRLGILAVESSSWLYGCAYMNKVGRA